jgi:Ca-activated chloride channel homolog
MQTLYTVADDAYLDIQFDPEYVKQYRVIGFDNKVGAIKDVQSTIEGGDIGSGYSSLISFEITPTQKNRWMGENKYPFQPVTFDLKYRVPLDTTHTLHLTERPEIYYAPFKEVPSYYRFASSVIMFGSLIRKSKFVKDVSWNELLELATSSAAPDNYSQKEFVTIVQQARNIYGKKSRKAKKTSS